MVNSAGVVSADYMPPIDVDRSSASLAEDLFDALEALGYVNNIEE
jgi:hypothetical protein